MTNYNNFLESVALVPKYIMLNPDDLKFFDEIVGARNRSKQIRDLIREFNKKHKRGKNESDAVT